MSRYDHFQSQAVAGVIRDFNERPAGRFLLVIPTGGGKTFTAVKSVARLFEDEILDPEHDRVLWVAHRTELLDQAQSTFDKLEEHFHKTAYGQCVEFIMRDGIGEALARSCKWRLAVIDEAHHAAATQYQPLFERQEIGILGLTATPSRHDGLPLAFERESFSIGFPDLVDLGVLLRPEIIRVDGGEFPIDLLDETSLSQLNTESRNSVIAEALRLRADDFTKAIVFVGSTEHAHGLYMSLRDALKSSNYEFIGFITGQDRARFLLSEKAEVHEDRSTFVERFKASERALVVNVDVLTEGYDDPSINTVVMAAPTRSKLRYMQAIGRAVRRDPENEAKRAFVIEVTDTLPNIRYRVDNRWLYSDISDALEPQVLDRDYATAEDRKRQIEDLLSQYNVSPAYRFIPQLSPEDRVTLLLFKYYVSAGTHAHIPIVVTNATRLAASQAFNFLSARIRQITGMPTAAVMKMVQRYAEQVPILGDEKAFQLIQQALENAWQLADPDNQAPSSLVRQASPWISFVAFRMKQVALPEDLIAFTEDMLNRDDIRNRLLEGAYEAGYVLSKLPLPLTGVWGEILTPGEFASLDSVVEEMRTLDGADVARQWLALRVLGENILPVPQKYAQRLPTIVREQMDYYRPLEK